MTNQGDVGFPVGPNFFQEPPPWAIGPTCHDCDPTECDEVLIERARLAAEDAGTVTTVADLYQDWPSEAAGFMATQEGKGQS